ncbi:MAG TPA: peptidoglycan-binding protein [Hyphomonadaceae bacterium]|nr:peptidoglycan-binding protein [Hyphomonadaceae bacterium]
MTQQGPWSVKGIDPKARSIARDRAQRQGVTLGQYLNSLLLDDEGGLIEDVQIAETAPRGANPGDLRRMSSEIDMLSRKLEEAQARSARAVSGLDKSILSLMGKMETSGKAQLGALERVMRAMTEIESTQTALRSRIDTLEANKGAGPTLDALKTLESSLDHLSHTLQDRVGAVEQDQNQFRSLFEEKVDSFTRSVDQAVTNAIRNTSGNLSSRIDDIEQQMSGAERRMEGALGRITDAASRFEAFESKAERTFTDASWKMERALEANLTRSRQMSKEVIERVEGIEEKTREAVNNLSDAVSRITDRLSRAERKSDTALHVLERSVSEIDEKVERGGRGPSAQDFDQIQSLFQKRLDSLADDLSRPVHALRADVETRLEEVMRSGASPERMERLERALRQVQDHIQVSEARQADAVEAMSAQVERLSRAIDERLRAVEAKGDSKSIEDVRREMLKLADTIDARLGGAMDAVRNDIGRLNTSVDDRIQALEKSSAAALDAVGEQVAVVAERMQKRHDESIKHLNTRIDETRVEPRQMDTADIDRLADRLDERVKESERRSAEAIGQIGEQVARVADRLQTQQIESVRMFETRLADSGRSHESRLNDLMDEMQRRMDEIGEQSHAKLGPVHNTISSIARRLETVEDRAPKRAKAPIIPPSAPSPAATEDFVILEDVGPAAQLIEEGSSGIVGVDPPPFDNTQDAELFTETPKPADGLEAEPVKNVEDLLETDDVVLAPKAETPVRDPLLDGGPSSFLAMARRAARENRTPAAMSGRKGIGRGPLIASAALAVAVAGGGALTVMRGKQEARADDFAKLDPAAPAIAAPGAGAEADLFGDSATAPVPTTTREPSAGELFDAPAAGTTRPADAKAATPAIITLEQAVRNGDPVALYDYAVELLGTGEKPRAVQMLKEAAGRGLVMAEYRLAKLYEKGEGVPRDIAAARSWTEKAAIGGNVKAMHDLAVFYAEGDAGPQSYAAAVEWFRQASDLGLVDSQYNLAVLYEQGLGLTQDHSEAAFWFEVAGRAGDQDGARRARAMLSDMPAAQAEQIKRRARAFTPKAPIARANGELGQRPWDAASPAQIAEVQRLLAQLGYSPGSADGKVSATTQNAIRAFEADNELTLTGQPSVTLLRHLRTSLNTAN